MNPRFTLGFASICAVVLSGVAGCDGCSSSSGPLSAGSDAGELDVSVDTGADATESDVTQTDTGTTTDTSTPGDAGADGATACSNGATPVHLPAGFSQVFASAVDPAFGYGLSMALDENDDPMLAYLAVAASVESGTAPVGCSPASTPQGCDALYFTRWDPCAGAFTTPVVVDPTLNYNGGNPGDQLISVAYDRSTKEVGIAYTKVFPTDPNWADAYDAIWLATSKSAPSGFVTQQVSDNLRWGNTDVSNNDTPTLTMSGGHLYLAFTASFEAPGCNYDPCLRFAASTTSPPDAGADAGPVEAGPPPPHYFDLSYVPYSGGGGGFDQLNPRSNALSIAVDSMGRPAIAAYQLPLTGYNTTLLYWRAGMTDSVKVTDTNDVQNDNVTLSLAFEGTSPRVAGLLTRNPGGASAYNDTYVSSPDDGTTWNAAEPFVLSAGLAFYTTFATDGKGNEVFTSHFNSSPGAAAVEAGCGTDPFVSRSSNSGASWSGCTLGTYDVHTNGNLASAFGASRIAGKFVMAGPIEGNGATTLDGGNGYSVVFYQDP
jgi:hypothetical protein